MFVRDVQTHRVARGSQKKCDYVAGKSEFLTIKINLKGKIIMYNEIQNEIRDLEEQVAVVKGRANRRNRAMDTGDRKNVHKMEEKIEELRLSLPANAPLTMPGASLGGSSGPFENLGDQLVAVAQAGKPGGRIDPRLYDIQAATGLGETVPSEGGFLVQTDFQTALLEDVRATGIVAPLCRRIPISTNSNSLKINGFDEVSRATTRQGGVLAYWLAESAEKIKSKPTFRQVELNLHKLIGLCYVSDELLADSTALNQIVQDAFRDEINFRIDDAIINGTGAGEPLGILSSAAKVIVAKEAAQPAATIVTENIVKMYSRRLGPKKNFVWLINQNIEPQLFTLHLDVGTGGIPVYMPAGGLNGLPYDSLFGLPVIPIEQCQSLGTEGDIILANFSDGYILAEKGGIRTDVSIHVQFKYDEQVFRFVIRVDGQPVRASALTPFKGGAGATQAHFITLADR